LDIFSEAPTTELKRDDIASMDIVSLVGSTVASSKGEGRRLIQGGGIYIDNERVVDPTAQVASTQILTKGFIILRSGKKNYHLVKAVD
jgi:tyrosyl-tRNA synthetase